MSTILGFLFGALLMAVICELSHRAVTKQIRARHMARSMAAWKRGHEAGYFVGQLAGWDEGYTVGQETTDLYAQGFGDGYAQGIYARTTLDA